MPRVQRQVVSYVRRSARMRPQQRLALARGRAQYVVEVPAAELSTSVQPTADVDWAQEFGRSAPLYVEIGPGTGENLVAVASARPDLNIVGFEVFEPALAATIMRLESANVSTVRLVQCDGVQGLRYLFANQSVTEVVTYFPDPWHKARHHKRRLVSPAFADLVASRLVPGGTWRLATDWDDYAAAMIVALEGCPHLRNRHPGWAPRPDSRPLTKYEQRGLAAGHTIHDLEFERIHD